MQAENRGRPSGGTGFLLAWTGDGFSVPIRLAVWVEPGRKANKGIATDGRQPGYPANGKAAWQPAREPPGRSIRTIGGVRANIGIKGCYPLIASAGSLDRRNGDGRKFPGKQCPP